MPLPRALTERMACFWNNYRRITFECEECGRLWVETDSHAFVSYLPETDARHILWSREHHYPAGSGGE